jgi:hypothetical protein
VKATSVDKYKSSMEVIYSQNQKPDVGTDLPYGDSQVKHIVKAGYKPVVKSTPKAIATKAQGGVVLPASGFGKATKVGKEGVVSSGTTKASSRPLSKQGSGTKEMSGVKSGVPGDSRDGSLRKPIAPVTSSTQRVSGVKGIPSSPSDKPKKKLLFVK